MAPPTFSNIQDPGGHGAMDPQIITQNNPSGAVDASSNPMDGQNPSINPLATSLADEYLALMHDGDLNFPPPDSQDTRTAMDAGTQPNHADIIAGQHSLRGGMIDQNRSHQEASRRYWDAQYLADFHRHSYSHVRTAPVQPPGSLFQNSHQIAVQQISDLQPSGPQNATAPAYQMMPQNSVNTPAQLETQHYASVRYRPVYSQPSYSRPNPYMPFPQWGVSPVNNQPRRHQRTQSSSSTASSVQGQQQAASVGQTARRRTRPASEANPQLPRRLSTSQVPRVPAVTTATSSSPTMAMGAPHYVTYLTPEDHVQIQRLAELQAYPSSMRPGGAVHGSHRQYSLSDDSIVDRAPPTPKGLDDKTDGRPEPKEDNELTLNLECKICMSQLVDTVIIPCGHAILCRWCAEQHMPTSRLDQTQVKGRPLCPMCRGVVKSKVAYALPYGEKPKARLRRFRFDLMPSQAQSTCLWGFALSVCDSVCDSPRFLVL
ncbi:hypothetical protein CNMCM5793_008397 [Aspergillus hiratsukae]|uniref:RING-type domain-containing protein n=1 Tax=Aspergillus hiratsukae TaxID=1194566 RepID=A0A8H6P715_9EURO|nr:hypothetical protein CNMCM5793_008397 [Aspergillus hiratsukae]